MLSKHECLITFTYFIYFGQFLEQPSLFYTPLSDPSEQLCVISSNICTAGTQRTVLQSPETMILAVLNTVSI